MKRFLLVLVLVGVAQPVFAQEMDVWQTKGGFVQAVDAGRSGEVGRAGGNVIDSRVGDVSQALNRANKVKAPRVSTSVWLSGAINGSSDSRGDLLVVARGRSTDLVDNRNSHKPKATRLAQAYQGGGMGAAWISPDGAVALVADDAQKHQVIELATGRTIAEGNANGARFVGQSTVYWWSKLDPGHRMFQNQMKKRVKKDDAQGGFFFGEPASADYFPCELTRLNWGGGGQPQTVTFSECSTILSVSRDGKSALLGNHGEVVSLPFGANRIEQDVFREIVRVDLETMERAVVARGQFLSPVASEDLTVFCSNDPDTIFEQGEVIVTCYRGGQRIDHRFTAPSGADITWRSIAVSPNGKQFAIRLTSEPNTATKPAKGLTYIQELGVGGEPLLTISGIGATTWLPGDRRLVFTTGHDPATLYDYKAGWQASIGRSKEQLSGSIVLGDRDDQFLIGKERGSTRDMLLVTVGGETK